MEHVEGGYNPQEEGEIPIPNPKPIEIERILVIEQNQEHDKPVPVSVSFPDTNSFFVVEVLKKGLEKQTSTLLEMMKLLFEKFSSPGSPVLSSPSGRQKPYPEVVDMENPYPRGYKILDFTLLSSEDGQSTLEHIASFTTQRGDLANLDNFPYYKLKLFPNSLIGTAFTRYSTLPRNSVCIWQEMERLFYTKFFKVEPEVCVAKRLKW
ncbi:uncharacterized protein LOC105641897 [Jatropha curcas]|uniref:uncharacterized protein LOC105641897 n=1 Tax=Jatropha curcas TaxID=180498 RepID=UPI0005FAC643|nr:uncharacterized protein LOC105641897 [Jatropha curcas]